MIELKDISAERIFKLMMFRLRELGFHDDFLENNFLSIVTDRAAVMFDLKKGVTLFLKISFPKKIFLTLSQSQVRAFCV